VKKTIIVSGMAGSGKSTLAGLIAKKYKLELFVAGDKLKEMISKEPDYMGFWGTKKGIEAMPKRIANPEFDKKFDSILIKRAKKGNVVFTSWTLPWVFKDSFKIWLSASAKKRAERLSKRDRISLKSAEAIVKKRDMYNKKIFKKIYNFDFGNDLSPFDLIINTDIYTIAEIFEICKKAIEKYFK